MSASLSMLSNAMVAPALAGWECSCGYSWNAGLKCERNNVVGRFSWFGAWRYSRRLAFRGATQRYIPSCCMKIWLDAQLPTQLATWMSLECSVDALAMGDIGLWDATDKTILEAARKANALLISNDSDFVEMVIRTHPPPKLIWLTCRNASNDAFKILLKAKLADLFLMLKRGDEIVELG